MAYLSGGRSLDGVTSALSTTNYQSPNEDESSPSYIANSSSSLNIDQRTDISFRRFGISTDELDHQLSLFLRAKPHHQIPPPNAVILDASRNQLTAIPDSLRHFTSLTQLNLSCNHITVLSPVIYLHLCQLKQLHLSENSIERIPEEMPFHLTQLEVLKLDRNSIKSLPESIGQWKKMREFRLGSEYGGNLLECLPDSISRMEFLTELDVSFNCLKNLLPTTFCNLRNLRCLNLSHNCIQRLPDANILFSECEQLSTLDLSNNQIKHLPIRATDGLAKLMRDKRLRLVNLSYNKFDMLPITLFRQPEAQVIIKGNPFGAYYEMLAYLRHRSIEETNHRLMSSAAILSHHFDDSMTQSYRNEYLLDEHVFKPNSKNEHHTTKGSKGSFASLFSFIPSLREVATRNLLKEIGMDSVSCKIPEHISDDIRGKAYYCYQCNQPVVYEWINEVLLKSYRSVPSVPQQISLCSTVCWKEYICFVEQQMLASENNAPLQGQDNNSEALQFIAQHGGNLEPGSFGWVEAAARASEQQARIWEYSINVPPS